MRLFFILVNTGLVLFGTGWVQTALPLVTALLAVALVLVVFQTQKGLWQMDMAQKRAGG
jgi:hypothetical protein